MGTAVASVQLSAAFCLHMGSDEQTACLCRFISRAVAAGGVVGGSSAVGPVLAVVARRPSQLPPGLGTPQRMVSRVAAKVTVIMRLMTRHLAPARAGRASERSVVRSCAGHWPEPGPASLSQGGCRGMHLLALSV